MKPRTAARAVEAPPRIARSEDFMVEGFKGGFMKERVKWGRISQKMNE